MDTSLALFLGAVVSALTQVIKKKVGTATGGTILVVAVLSLAVSTAYYFLEGTRLWEAFLQIAGFAGAVYTYLIARFE